MAPFKVHAPYQPMGDQPAAIEKLVAGVENNLRHQTLLGATGTGKSLGYHEPLFIVELRGAEQSAQLTPIGPLIDALLAEHSDQLRADGDTLILDCAPATVRFATQAFNPATGAVDLTPIQSFTRHCAPAAMYRLTTACGRSATLTGDHNLWVLRDGQLTLIETADARPSDYVPLPKHLVAPASTQATDAAALNALTLTPAMPAASAGTQPVQAMVRGPQIQLDDAHELPANWPQLSNQLIAHYVYSYFTLAATAAGAALAAAVADRHSASELGYALLRFGIHARLEADDAGGWLVTIREPAAVRRFNEQIGFPAATEPRLLAELKAADSPISAYPQIQWTAVASVEPIAYAHPYVYDLSVPGAETFLAGEGGLFVHNTYVMAQIVEQVQRPTLVMAHNKTLAAQLYAEFKEFFPDNAVGYFVSYYDAFTPEAYVPSKDLYIEKEAQINEEIDRLRHEATQALFTRRDVLIVASVSAIYGLGSPTDYGQVALSLRTGEVRNRDKVLRTLIDLQFERNDIDFHRGTFRVRGDTLEIFPANAETAYRVEMWGDEIERMVEVDPLTGEVLVQKNTVDIFPAKHFVTTTEKTGAAISDIEQELAQQLLVLEGEGKILEAARLKQRTMYDLEIMQELGYCSGIENYSRHLDRRAAGQTPWTLLDYFPDDFLLFVDESHISLPQIRGMFNGDRSRKQTLVDFGFRLPSALDNRPLTFDEFERHVHQAVYVSATPGPYEYEHSELITEQIIRPTGLIDPVIQVRPSRGQVDDLLGEIKRRVDSGSRALVTTLTKRMAEDLTDYLKEMGVRTQYLHSDVDTLERIDILRDLRLGVYDVLVGINLLREGLDLPEVSLVAILDADKEGFLRSQSALIQTVGRAARHLEGTVLMYADRITPSMQHAIDETRRRRTIQEEYNRAHGIEPRGIVKEVRDLTDRLKKVADEKATYKADGSGSMELSKDELFKLVSELEKQMKQAAKELEFEKAALLRDQVHELRRTLALIDDQAMVESVSHSRPRASATTAPADTGKKKLKGRPRGKL